MLDRPAIVQHLREIAALLELQGANRYKARAFARGARALEDAREPIADLVSQQRLAELPGIGASLAHQIEELHRTGGSELLRTLRAGLPSGVLELGQVPGIGLHALRTLSRDLGISTIAELREAAAAGRLRDVAGFGAKREARILQGIQRYETTAPELLLSDGLRLATTILREIEEIPQVEGATIAGTLRRFLETSTSLAIVVSACVPLDALDRVASLPRVASVLDRTPSKRLLRLADGARLEVTGCTPDTMATALLHATGSTAHVAKLRSVASAAGLALTPEGLFSSGERLPTPDEASLYRALGLAFVPPELREDTGEVEEAARGDLDLVRGEDLTGFVHCHTTWSDGKDGIEAMALAARERGATFITITDHSANAHYAGGLNVERLLRQWEEIDEVRERVPGIVILKGTEADILADGALDWPDRVLEGLDVVIASIHNRYRQDESTMTDRLLRALRQPVFKIWGHPLGRLVSSRPPIACRVPEVLDALASSRGAIEINGSPHRLDLEPMWSREARARGLRFVLSVDAHATRELDNVKYAVGIARRAGLRRGDVLNALSAKDFARAVHP